MKLNETELIDRLKKIKLLLLDVDGVLTDGRIIYDDNGNEIKQFSVKDGLGIRLLNLAGIATGIVTGRRSKALIHRCRNLGIDLVFDGIADKAAALDEIIRQGHWTHHEIAFVGDDLPDLPLMRCIGVSIAVADAHRLVIEQADMVTAAGGGDGAVREVCEAILEAQNLWENVMERFSP